MTSRQRSFLIIGAIVIGLAAIIYGVSSNILLNGFATLEAQSARRDLQRVQEALANKLVNLDRQLSDWANWDDTYTFVEDINSAYSEANLTDKALSDLRVNMIVYVNTAGQVVYSKGVDLLTGSDAPVPNELLARLVPGDPLLEPAVTGTSVSGFILLPQAALLVAAKPILTNEGNGPAHGTLIFGQYLDEAEIASLAQITHLNISVQRLDQTLPPDFQDVRATYAPATPLPTHLLDAQTIAAYAQLTDLANQPIAFVRVDEPRTIYQQGLTSLSFFYATLLVLCLGFGAVIWILLARLLRRTQRESEAMYRAVIEQTSEGVILADSGTQRVLESNAAAQRLLGYTASELSRLALADLAMPSKADDQPSLLAPEGGPEMGAVSEVEYRRKDGSPIMVEISLNLIVYGGEKRLCAVFRDITERTQAERLIKTQTGQLQAQNKELQRQTEELSTQSRRLAQAETELRRLNADLEERVAERTSKLRKANAELAQAMRTQTMAGATAPLNPEIRPPSSES
jgi:PAS domain S-box-containing protein